MFVSLDLGLDITLSSLLLFHHCLLKCFCWFCCKHWKIWCICQKSLKCDCLYVHFEIYFQVTDDFMTIVCLPPRYLIFCYYDLAPCFKHLIFNFFFSSFKDFSEIFTFLLALLLLGLLKTLHSKLFFLHLLNPRILHCI